MTTPCGSLQVGTDDAAIGLLEIDWHGDAEERVCRLSVALIGTPFATHQAAIASRLSLIVFSLRACAAAPEHRDVGQRDAVRLVAYGEAVSSISSCRCIAAQSRYVSFRAIRPSDTAITSTPSHAKGLPSEVPLIRYSLTKCPSPT